MALETEHPRATHVELQRLLEEARAGGSPDAYAGKRDNTRFSEGMQLEVTTDPSDPEAAYPATMRDLSLGGLSFGSRRPLFPGEAIFVREFSAAEPNPWLPATVRHVTASLQGALIGAAFKTDTDETGFACESETHRPASRSPRLPRPIRIEDR